MHAKDTALWRVQNRRAEQRAIDTTIGNGKDSTLKVCEIHAAIVSFGRIFKNALFDISKTFFITIPKHRHNQTFLRANGNADIVEMIFDNVRAIDASVDTGNILQGLHSGFDKKGHEAKLAAMFCHKLFLHLLAQLHNGSHIHFVECR